MMRGIGMVLMLAALAVGAQAHNVFGIAPHVTTAIETDGKTVSLKYQAIELGQGTSFARMNAGEIQQNERRYNFFLGRLKQIGELETGVGLELGGKAVEPGKYLLGFHVDEKGNYSVIVCKTDEAQAEVARQVLPLSDIPGRVPFLVQAFGPSETAGEISYTVHFGNKTGSLALKTVAGEE